MLNTPTMFRYVGRLFLVRLLAFLIGLVAILQTLDLLKESDNILAVPGATSAQILLYLQLRLPQLINQFTPFALLLATLTTLVTLAQNSEIVILKAAGLSPHAILRPLFAVGLAVACVHFLFAELVVAPTTDRLKTWQDADYALNPPDPHQGSGHLWVTDGPSIISADAVTVSKDTLILNTVEIYRRDARGNIQQVTNARRAVLLNKRWTLQEVRIVTLPDGKVQHFGHLDWNTTIPAERFIAVAIEADRVSYWRLSHAVRELSAGGHATSALQASLYHKISGPLSSAIMPLLGSVAAFGLARSGGLFLRVVIGMALGFAFFVADNMMLALGQFGATPPLLAAWAPLVLFFLIGEAVLFRTEE